jgi:hypothetical protein
VPARQIFRTPGYETKTAGRDGELGCTSPSIQQVTYVALLWNTALLVAITLDDKAGDALADAKTADDKAGDALAKALLEAKASDDKASAGQVDAKNADDKAKE